MATRQSTTGADWAAWAIHGVPAEIADSLTCEGDQGHGPCGTYRDWADGRCAKGHAIEIAAATTTDARRRQAGLELQAAMERSRDHSRACIAVEYIGPREELEESLYGAHGALYEAPEDEIDIDIGDADADGRLPVWGYSVVPGGEPDLEWCIQVTVAGGEEAVR